MPSRDTQAAIYIENVEFFIAKLSRFCKDVSPEEMVWSPPGVRNALSWIVPHCAGLLWASYARVFERPVPEHVKKTGIAPSLAKGVEFGRCEDAPPGTTCEACMEGLHSAWNVLREALQEDDATWESRTLTYERKERSVWALLWHTLADLCYHTGQASTVRKLIARQRRRGNST